MAAPPALKNRHLNASPHLGFKPTPPDRLKKIPRIKHYFNPLHAGVLPDQIDYTQDAKKSFLQMLGNNQQGDCSIAAVLKQAGLASANRPNPKELVSNDQEALRQYPIICGRGDQGCYVPDVLDYWRDKGLTVGGVVTKIDGYALVDPTDELLMRTCIYLFCSLHVGMLITSNQYQNARPGGLWDVDRSPIIGGHSIPLGGYRTNDQFPFGTWAMELDITRAAIADPRAQAEVYVILDQQWYDQDGLSAHGIKVDDLKRALDIIKGGGTPPIPEPPSPPVPPVPPTPPAPAGALVLDGALKFLGQDFPIHLTQTGGAQQRRGVVNWWGVLTDVAGLIAAVESKDFAAAIACAEKLLTDLGLALTDQERIDLARMIQTHAETAPLANSGPPADWRG